MNLGARVRINIERLDGHGHVLEHATISFYRQPFQNMARWFVRRGGRKSQKVDDLTITEIRSLLGVMVRDWLKK